MLRVIDLFTVEPSSFVSFADLPNQALRKSVMKGFEFTLMAVGESGVGKTTLLNNLFSKELGPDRLESESDGIIQEKENPPRSLETSSVEIRERKVKVRVNIVDTSGFGDAIDNTDSLDPILQYIDDQNEKYLLDESGLVRKNIVDKRVHCCLYFISPYSRGLSALDVDFMKKLHRKVNLVPVIGKADALTKREVRKLKDRIMEGIKVNGIEIYSLPEYDSDEEEDDEKEAFKVQLKQLKEAFPFAVCGANTICEIEDKRVRGRAYPWGVIDIDNPNYCDFVKLRTMLITHMQDLRSITEQVFYENYRNSRLGEGLQSNECELQADEGLMGARQINLFSNLIAKDCLLQEKEAKLKTIREKMALIEAQIPQPPQ